MGDNSQKPKVDPVIFTKRLHGFINNWQDPRKFEQLWKNADGIVFVLGKATNEDPPYRKTTSLHNWLLGYEFPETVLVFCERELYVLASAKKIQILEPLQKGMQDEKSNLKLHLLVTNAEDANKSNFTTLITALKASKSGKNVGIVGGNAEKMVGTMATSWEDSLRDSGLIQVEIRLGLSDLFSVKDSQEIGLIKQASDISAKIMERKLISSIEEHIDQETEVTHTKLAEEMDEILESPEKVAELLKNSKLKTEVIEACYTPIIQSGGEYELHFTAASNEKNLHSGTIVCSLGARYRSYCANITRTLFVDPKKEVEDNYKVLLDVFAAVVRALKVGNKMSQTMEEAAKVIQKQAPQLVNKFTKTCGYGIGIEFQENYTALSAKNIRTIKPGMAFNVAVGFENIELSTTPKDPKSKIYAMFIADTVITTESGPEVLTDFCKKDFTERSYSLEDEEPEPAAKSSVKKEKGEDDSKSKKPVFSDTSRRGEKVKSRGDDAKLKKHQEELAKKLARNRELELTGASSSGTKEREVNAYTDPSSFPSEAQKNKVYVDVKRETVLIPLFGSLVPFHITKIKNVSKTEDILRINFSTPTAVGNAHGAYIKEVSIRIVDQKVLNNNLRLIKELRKRVQERVIAADLKENLVEQAKLQLSKQKNPRLGDLYIRPNFQSRRTPGTLELHVNGCRFTTNKNATVDILYSNIKHAFFQPSDNELIILIHFHLHHDIMIGKKKVTNVQFYSEVLEGSQHLDHGSRSYDRDEIEDEQREAEIRNKLNRDFQNFIKKAEEVAAVNGTDLEFDIPYRDLGFYGVPVRSNVLLQPTVHCLVSLVEAPFFVLSLSDVEICHFERVQFGLRNFDMIFVHKDLKTVSKVNNVPMESLETIKEWLDSCNIKFYEGPTNLNWSRILATIREDVEKFYKEDGAWDFLKSDSSGGEESDSDEGSEYSLDEGGSSGSDEDDEDDYESEASEESDEDEDEESDESGEDWDSLAKRAAAEDKIRGSFGDMVAPKRKRSGEYSDDEQEKEKEREKKKDQKPKKKAAPRK